MKRNSINYVIVKRPSKVFENSFLKNGILEFRSVALIVSILSNFSNDNMVQYLNTISKKCLLRFFVKIFENCH